VRGKGAGSRLFARDELCLRPTGTARLRELARRPTLRATDRQQRADEDRRSMDKLRGWGAELVREFGLKRAELEPERDGVIEHYGICYEDGLIRIRLRHATSGKQLKESSLVDTLCHELAHLEQLNHGPRFRRLYRRILERARELGYYRPGIVPGERSRQVSLFDDESCGSMRG
jgi:hypothetical protein